MEFYEDVSKYVKEAMVDLSLSTVSTKLSEVSATIYKYFHEKEIYLEKSKILGYVEHFLKVEFSYPLSISERDSIYRNFGNSEHVGITKQIPKKKTFKFGFGKIAKVFKGKK